MSSTSSTSSTVNSASTSGKGKPTSQRVEAPGRRPAHRPASKAFRKPPSPRLARFFSYLTLALFLFTSWHAFMPNPGGSGLGNLDKLMHGAAFFALALTAALAQRPSPRNTWRLTAALLAYGALIEVAQRWIPGRDASGLDLLADAVGTACGLAVAWALRRWGPLRQLPRVT